MEEIVTLLSCICLEPTPPAVTNFICTLKMRNITFTVLKVRNETEHAQLKD